MRFSFSTALFSLSVSAAFLFSSGAAEAHTYRPYQAVYDLKLKEVRESGDVTGVSGRLVFKLDGDACSGYITESRFVMQVEREGGEVVTDIRSSNWEAGDASSMRFFSSTRMNGQLLRSIEGSAKKEDNALIVRHTKPEEQTFRFSNDAVFPMQFHRSLMDAVTGDQRFLSARLFDGGEEKGEPIEVSAFMGPKRDVAEGEAAPGAPFAPAEGYWPINMAYFDADTPQDGGPSYSVSFVLATDGIERSMTLDYGGFTVEAVLQGLDISAPPPAECR